MDSINTCIWPGSMESTRHNTFCWRGWSYFDTEGVTDDCLTYLQSGPAGMYTTLPTNYSLHPGDCIDQFGFTVYDAWEREIMSNLQWDIISSNGQNHLPIGSQSEGSYDATSPCLLPDVEDGDDYSHIHLKILVHPPQLTGIVLDLRFKPCENGSIFTSQKGCTHPGLYYTTCDNTANYMYGDYQPKSKHIRADASVGIASNINAGLYQHMHAL